MNRLKVYEYAISNVPKAMKACLDKSRLGIEEVKKIFIHQDKKKLDETIIKRLFRLYGVKGIPEFIMPMNLYKLKNSSIATVPTLLDMIKLEDHSIILLASVGPGMNINIISR